MPVYVLDTSAILCVFYHEDGAEEVVEILEGGQSGPSAGDGEVLVPFIALMEMEYWLRRRLSAEQADHALLLVENWPVRIVESHPQWRRVAARMKASASMSVADAWISALAIVQDGELVHKDPEFDQVGGLKARRLPYKGGGRAG
jgi:predicted nucleic acid-binding protein